MYDLVTIGQALDALPPKPREASMREGVRQIDPQIRTALGKAYSFAEICELLGAHGMAIKESTLRAYLREMVPKPERKAPAKARAKPPLKKVQIAEEVVATPSVKRGVIRTLQEL